MCGIAGFTNRESISSKTLSDTSSLLNHRGPDDEGFLIVTEDGAHQSLRGDSTIPHYHSLHHVKKKKVYHRIKLGLLHRRLSIIDLTSSGHQPMISPDNNYILIYNGEVYNYIELRKELESKGYHFHSTSDTEVVLYSFIEWGSDCVEKFIGMWALVIFDKKKDRLFLSRDRFGIKPLYYTYNNRRLSFASEVKSLIKLNGGHEGADAKVLYKYLVFNDPRIGNRTLFNNVLEIPAGGYGIYDFQNNDLQIRKYYNLNNFISAAIPAETINSIEENLVNQYRTLLSNSISIHLRSDVKIGSCLSGGLDSSAIVRLGSKKLHDQRFNTFTAAYKNSSLDETQYAKLAIKNRNNIKQYFTYPTAGGFWQSLDQLIWYQDFPISSTSGYAQWMVMKQAAEHNMKVLLDGQGADESLGGYPIFAGFYLLSYLKSLRISSFLKASFDTSNNRLVNVPIEIGRSIFHVLPPSLQHLVLGRNRLVFNVLQKDFRDQYKQVSKKTKYTLDYNKQCVNSIQSGLQTLLRYEDRNSMAFSIESRVPYLDHRLVEYSLNIPIDYKFKNGYSKYILRKTLASEAPADLVWRKDKLGFVTPQLSWKKALAHEIDTYLSNLETSQIFDLELLKQNMYKLTETNKNISDFWKIISVLKWIKIYDLSIRA